MAICIFVKGLWGEHTSTAEIYEKDPQTLSEVIRLVEKLNAVQQLTAKLAPTMISIKCNDDIYFVCRQMDYLGSFLATTAQCTVLQLQ